MPKTQKKTIVKIPKTIKVDPDLRSYELMIVVSSRVKAEKRGEIVAKLTKSITDLAGKSVKTEELGLKDLAYSIRHEMSGWYALLNFSLPAEAVKKMDDIVKREEKIIRYLLVKKDK